MDDEIVDPAKMLAPTPLTAAVPNESYVVLSYQAPGGIGVGTVVVPSHGAPGDLFSCFVVGEGRRIAVPRPAAVPPLGLLQIQVPPPPPPDRNASPRCFVEFFIGLAEVPLTCPGLWPLFQVSRDQLSQCLGRAPWGCSQQGAQKHQARFDDAVRALYGRTDDWSSRVAARRALGVELDFARSRQTATTHVNSEGEIVAAGEAGQRIVGVNRPSQAGQHIVGNGTAPSRAGMGAAAMMESAALGLAVTGAELERRAVRIALDVLKQLATLLLSNDSLMIDFGITIYHRLDIEPMAPLLRNEFPFERADGQQLSAEWLSTEAKFSYIKFDSDDCSCPAVAKRVEVIVHSMLLSSAGLPAAAWQPMGSALPPYVHTHHACSAGKVTAPDTARCGAYLTFSPGIQQLVIDGVLRLKHTKVTGHPTPNAAVLDDSELMPMLNSAMQPVQARLAAARSMACVVPSCNPPFAGTAGGSRPRVQSPSYALSLAPAHAGVQVPAHLPLVVHPFVADDIGEFAVTYQVLLTSHSPPTDNFKGHDKYYVANILTCPNRNYVLLYSFNGRLENSAARTEVVAVCSYERTPAAAMDEVQIMLKKKIGDKTHTVSHCNYKIASEFGTPALLPARKHTAYAAAPEAVDFCPAGYKRPKWASAASMRFTALSSDELEAQALEVEVEEAELEEAATEQPGGEA